jgi:RNA polymerase sigma-70 factor, ECF subfamily
MSDTAVTPRPAAAYEESVGAVTSALPAIARAPGDTRPSFAATAERHLDDVYRYLLYMTRNSAVADDLTGETFERALRAWSRFDPRRGSAAAWLCQLARTTALDHFRSEERRRRREQRYARERGAEVEELPMNESLPPALQEILAGLSAAEREILALRVVLELDGPEAARVLGISRTACSTRLSRAVRKLEERMAADALP